MDKNLQKATLEELLRRKLQAQNDRMSFREIEITELEIAIPFQKLPISSVLEMMEEMEKESGIGQNYEKCVELIYNSCPMLRDRKMLEGCAEPYDVVPLVFEDNIAAILNTAAKIMGEFYGVKEIEKIKN